MTYDYLHRGYRSNGVTGGYCEKCERDTPHRNLVCSVCKSTAVGRGDKTINAHVRHKMESMAAAHKSYLGGEVWIANMEKKRRIDKRKAFKDSAAKFRAMFEGTKDE